jgi:hypothetical protein
LPKLITFYLSGLSTAFANMSKSAWAFVIVSMAVWQMRAGEVFLQRETEHNERLIESLEAVLGPDGLRARVDKLENHLRPLFNALPKHGQNMLSHASARYALHRVIGDLHGWSIAGLEPSATTYNTTSLVGSGILRGVVPPHIERILDDYVGGQGFSLYDLAVLAGTIEHLVHDDQKVILRRVCEVFDLPTLGHMDAHLMRRAILMYKAMFLVGTGSLNLDISKFTAQDAEKLLSHAGRRYPGWEDVVVFMDDEIQSLAFEEKSLRNPFKASESSLQVALRVVERAADHFTRHVAELECQEMRDELLAFEIGDTGRVRLADFYRASLDARFFYTETKEYLQALGALDMSDALRGPKVIVSNYILAKSNCLAHSNTYSICCLNECESLYKHLEDSTATTGRTPHRIAELVAAMSSSTVQAPRNLSQALVRRLEEISLHGSGDIFLHSRLFAQWMHQGFPRECSYPHLIGTTTSLSPTAWARQHGLEFRIDHKGAATRSAVLNATVERLEREFAFDENSVETEREADDLMWTIEDEKFAEPTTSLGQRLASMLGTILNRLGFVVFLSLCIASAIVIKAGRAIPVQKQAGIDSVFV